MFFCLSVSLRVRNLFQNLKTVCQYTKYSTEFSATYYVSIIFNIYKILVYWIQYRIQQMYAYISSIILSLNHYYILNSGIQLLTLFIIIVFLLLFCAINKFRNRFCVSLWNHQCRRTLKKVHIHTQLSETALSVSTTLHHYLMNWNGKYLSTL